MGIGIDCVGLILEAGAAAGVLKLPPILNPAFTSYGLLPNPMSMKRAMAEYMVPITEDDMDDGDVGFFSIGESGRPMHLAIMARQNGRRTMIHADAQTTLRRVVEVGYAAQWPRWLDGFWRYPGIPA
jgi:cell wall-associated NlpC family hydrolase